MRTVLDWTLSRASQASPGGGNDMCVSSLHVVVVLRTVAWPEAGVMLVRGPTHAIRATVFGPSTDTSPLDHGRCSVV